MKKILALLLVIGTLLCFSACYITSTTSGNEPTDSTPSSSTESIPETLKFVLTAGEAGEYGKLVTYNKGTEFEETFYVFYIPEGTYTVTNKGKYMSQVNVYSNETRTTEEGWEEPAEVGDVKLLDVGKSATITVAAGQHIDIGAENSVFEFQQQ